MTTVSVLALASQQQMIKTQTIKGSFNQHLLSCFLVESNIPTNTVILLDNAAIHKTKLIKQTALQLGIELLYVPPYSPWFNPIEGVFSIIKRAFYKGLSIDESFQSTNEHHYNAFFKKSISLKARPKI